MQKLFCSYCQDNGKDTSFPPVWDRHMKYQSADSIGRADGQLSPLCGILSVDDVQLNIAGVPLDPAGYFVKSQSAEDRYNLGSC